MRKFNIAAILACVCALSACTDDSVGVPSHPVGPNPPVIIDDPPVTDNKAGVGESCSTLECADDLVCEDEICVKYVGAAQSCNKTHICLGDLVCTDGTCVNEVSGEGMSCEDDASCQENLKCDSGICKMTAQVGESCENAICLEGECIGNVCSIYVDENEDCSREKGHICQEGLVCHEFLQTCYKALEQGADCDPLDDRCAEGMSCHEEAMRCMTKGALGDTCSDEANQSCDVIQNLMCIDGKCRELVEADCDELHVCADKSTLCYEGKCIVSHECTEDKECKSDTYCCTEEACKVKNICLPYGEGPRTNINEACLYETVPGLFEADIQCEWKDETTPGKTANYQGGDYPNHANVLMTPLVMNTPHDSGTAQEIIFSTYNNGDGGTPSGQGADLKFYGVIRIINAETCQLHESIYDPKNHIIAGSNLAMADLNGDGKVEIVASRGGMQQEGATVGGGIVIFDWDDAAKHYKTKCNSTEHTPSTCTWDEDNKRYNCTNTLNWGGSAIHDINNDGKPEIIGFGGDVFDADCKRINKGQSLSELSYTPALADLNHDGNIEIIGTKSIYTWDNATNTWKSMATFASGLPIHHAIGDFGTPTASGFDFNTLDGIAEIVSCGNKLADISTIDGKSVMRYTIPADDKGGGPCTVGDFDGDNLPEIAAAYGKGYYVFDPRCKASDANCQGDSLLWFKASQDWSSASTGSSLFDFDGDGAMEVVYADECYTRVYDGKTGDVLFSAYRASGTWHEYPVIADVDNDQSAEIVVGSNNNISCETDDFEGTTYTDIIHNGLRCAKDSECKSGTCKKRNPTDPTGLCLCTSHDQCKTGRMVNGVELDEYWCRPAMAVDKKYLGADAKVCRAKRELNPRVTGVRVLKDKLDRWVSSRNIWNQHAYAITNINNDQTIPDTSKWLPNFLTTMQKDGVFAIASAGEKKLNNFRQNTQGTTGAGKAPDITGKLDKENLCVKSSESNGITLKGMICNRGTKMVASKMPASFYELDADNNQGKKYCTAYTASNVPVGGCLEVSCTLEDTDIVGKTIRMVANDDGNGGKTTVECIEDNNTDEVKLEACEIN